MGGIGIIGDAPPPPISWTTISDGAPDSSENFLAMVMQRQNQAILNNPGTLSYTPASSTPAAAVAPWNSWLQPNCAPGSSPAAAAAIGGSSPAAGMIPDSSPPAAVSSSPSPFWIAVGLAAGLASVAYLANQMK